MQYKDYYKVMELGRDATQDEIKRAYRKLARKYHPDVSKEADAETKFKALGEAYEVLKDIEKRAAYDQLGANWQAGEAFRPPPNWDEGFEFKGDGHNPGESAQFSDFFEQLFRQGGFASGNTGQQRQDPRQHEHARGEDSHAKIHIDLEDSYHGAARSISLSTPEMNAQGQVQLKHRNLNVKIPKGIRAGQHIKLAGQGSPGFGTAQAGDLLLEIEFNPHPLYRVSEAQVYLDLPISPWEAALGAKIKVPTPDGLVDLKVPPNSKQGGKLRLAGRGIPGKTPGDFFVVLQIALPPATTDTDKAAYQSLQQAFDFNPRQALTAIKSRKIVNNADSYFDKSPLAPLFQRGGINDLFAGIAKRRPSPFEKAPKGIKGIEGGIKIHKIMIFINFFINLMAVPPSLGSINTDGH